MILVLAHMQDRGAAAVARTLAARHGADAVCDITPAELARPRRWTHTVDANGRVDGELVLMSGRRVESARIECALNRIRTLSPPAFVRAGERERDYAAAELQALLVSWLAGLGRPVVHAPGGVGPVAARSRRQWLAGAIRAGIPVAREIAATSDRLVPSELRPALAVVGRSPGTANVAGQPVEARDATRHGQWRVLVAGERVHGPLPGGIARRCRELARDGACGLLGLTFAGASRRPRLVDVDPFPPLLDEASASAAADLLERLSGAPA
jgi:hypothetical protein